MEENLFKIGVSGNVISLLSSIFSDYSVGNCLKLISSCITNKVINSQIKMKVFI
jgi:hypothetical protein